MALELANRRRWVGGAVLLSAAVMLIAGETVLKGKLNGIGFLLYWLVCLVLTSAAIVLALADLRAQRQTARTAQRELLESALKEIEIKAREKQGYDARGSKPGSR